MDIKSLEAFVRLYELNSLRKTAAALYLSPQGLSRTIQALEGELGVVLFDRSAKGMVPTDTAEYFYNYASEMLRSYGRVTSDLKKIERRPRELTFVCSYGVMNSLPYERFVRFKESHPQYSIRWEEYPDAEAERRVVTNRCDFGLLVLRPGLSEDEYRITPLFSRRPVLLVYEGHPLYGRESVEFADLKNERLIMQGKTFRIYDSFREKCVAAGFLPNVAAETGDFSFCCKLASMGEGLGVSLDFLADFMERPGLRAIPFSDESFCWDTALVRRRDAFLTPAGQAFCDFLTDEFRK